MKRPVRRLWPATALMLSAAACLILSPSPTLALGDDIKVKTTASAHISYWTSADDGGIEESYNAVDYQSEGIKTWAASANLYIKNKKVLGARAQRPFTDPPKQQMAIAKTRDATNSIQDYRLYLQLKMFGLLWEDPIWRYLKGVRIDYHSFYFHGKGVAQMSTVFAGRDSEEILLGVDDEFQFQAQFEDWYLTLYQSEKKWMGMDLGIGVFKSVLTKPHETSAQVSLSETQEARLVVDTQLESAGVFCRLSRGSFEYWGRFGICDFEAMTDQTYENLYNRVRGRSTLHYFRWNPNFLLFKDVDKRHEMSLGITVGFMLRSEAADLIRSDDGSDREIMIDVIADLGAQFRWTF